MVRTGSFNIPGNWIYSSGATRQGPGGISIDQPKARNYMRGLLPPEYDFSDEEVDILIAGQSLPGEVSDYGYGAGGQGPRFKTAVLMNQDDTPEQKETTETGPTGSQVSSVPLPPPPAFTGPGGQEVEKTDPEYKLPSQSSGGMLTKGSSSEPFYDFQQDRFYGRGGQYIDPITGVILGDAPVGVTESYPVSTLDYDDIFPVLQYGTMPSSVMQDLDRIGLGLDYIRNNAQALYNQNPNFLQSWWENTFLPVYNERMRDADRNVEISAGTTWNPFANIGFTGQYAPMGYANLQFPGMGLGAGDIDIDPGIADAVRSEVVSGITPITGSDIGVDPGISTGIREDVVSGIDPITGLDIRVDPGIGAGIREDVVSGIDPITGADLGIGETDLDALFAPLTDRMSGIADDFSRGGFSEVNQLLGNLENRLEDVEEFDVGDQFLTQPTAAAQNLLDMLYGTAGGTGPTAGISGFRAPASIEQLANTIGTFGPGGTGLGGQISALQDALANIDLSQLTAPTGLDALISDVGQLGDMQQPLAGLANLQTALGGFGEDERNALDLLLNLIGPQGIASLDPGELATLIDNFRGLSQSAFGASLDDLLKPQLEAYLGVDSPLYQNILNRIPDAKSIADAIDLPDVQPAPSPGPAPGPGPGTAPDVRTTGLSDYLTQLQDAISGTSALDTDPITADYLRTQDPITQSFLADLSQQQEQDEQEMLEQLQRFGIITSGEAGEQMFDLASAQRREELDVLSDAATRVEEERRGRYSDALELGRTLQQREIGLAELLGVIDGEKTLAGREYDLDILATVIAAMDPNLDLTGSSEEQQLLASVLLDMLNRDPNATTSDFIKRIREALNI